MARSKIEGRAPGTHNGGSGNHPRGSRRTISYGIDQDGMVVSRIGSFVAIPVIDWEALAPRDCYELRYDLETMSVLELASDWDRLKWTRKVTVEVKNRHRKHWGLKPLEVSAHG